MFFTFWLFIYIKKGFRLGTKHDSGDFINASTTVAGLAEEPALGRSA